MNNEKQKVLIFGLGQFAKGLLKEFSSDWHVIVVDIHESRITLSKEEIPDAEYIHGAAESPVTWKKLDLTNLKYIISAVRSPEVDLEVCRIARTHFKLKIPIIVLVYNDIDKHQFDSYHVNIVNPLELGIQVVLQNMSTQVSYPANVGLGTGELVEVSVKARSHLIDRKLKYLRPARWRISALYRDNQLILPDGNCEIKMGDRVLLVGDPSVIKNITETFTRGLPQFPLQYGQEIMFPLQKEFNENMDEAFYWINSFKARNIRFIPFKNKLPDEATKKIKAGVEKFKIGQGVERFSELFPFPSETGIAMIPVNYGWFIENRMRMAFKYADKPFLISRNKSPYDGIIVHLNGPDPGQAMETSVEIATLLNIPYQAIYVTQPKAMRGQTEDQRLRLRRQILSDYEAIYKNSIPYHVLEGNPVQETLKFNGQYDNHLLVIVTRAKASLSVFNPNVAYYIAKKSDQSILVIPEALNDE